MHDDMLIGILVVVVLILFFGLLGTGSYVSIDDKLTAIKKSQDKTIKELRKENETLRGLLLSKRTREKVIFLPPVVQ